MVAVAVTVTKRHKKDRQQMSLTEHFSDIIRRIEADVAREFKTKGSSGFGDDEPAVKDLFQRLVPPYVVVTSDRHTHDMSRGCPDDEYVPHDFRIYREHEHCPCTAASPDDIRSVIYLGRILDPGQPRIRCYVYELSDSSRQGCFLGTFLGTRSSGPGPGGPRAGSFGGSLPHKAVLNWITKSTEPYRELGTLERAGPIIERLKDPRKTVRVAAIRMLGHLADVEAVDPLIKALANYDQEIRMHAATSLGQLGDVRAIQPLVELEKRELMFKEARYLPFRGSAFHFL